MRVRVEERLKELLEKKKKAEVKLADLKTKLGHPHLDAMSAHDLADQEFKVWSAHLEDIERQLLELKRKK